MARTTNTKLARGFAGLAASAALMGVSTPVWAQTLYVSNASTNTLSMVPVDTSKAKVDITVGANPQGVAVSRDGRYAYTANAGENTVSAIDTARQSVIGTWTVGTQPYAVAVSADGSKLYVANYINENISILDASTGSELQTFYVGAGPIGMTVSPDGNYLAVSHYASNDAVIISISGSSAVYYATVQLGGWHYAPAFSADSATAYFPVTSGYMPFDLASKTLGAIVGTGADTPHTIAVDASDTFYQANYLGTELYYGSVSGTAPFSSVTAGSKITSLSLNTSGSMLYAALYGTHGATTPSVVKAFQTSDMTNTITYNVGGNPTGVAYSQHDFIPVPTAVPTLTEWAMILMGVVLAGFAALTLQRRRHTV